MKLSILPQIYFYFLYKQLTLLGKFQKMRMTYDQYKKKAQPGFQSKEELQEQLIEPQQEIKPAKPTTKRVKRYRSFCSTLMIILTIGLSSFYYGYSMFYLPSMSFSFVYSLYNITIAKSVAQGVLVAAIPLGGGLGAMTSSVLLKKFSRRTCLLIVNTMVIGATLLLVVRSFEFFVIARLLQGYCTGLLSSIAPLMMKELSPIEISGTLTSFHSMLIAFGATFAFVFSLILSSVIQSLALKWTILAGFCLIIPLIQTLLLLTSYRIQTPKYLLLNQRQQDAKQLVTRIYKDQYVDEVLKEMKDNLKTGDQQEEKESEKSQQDAIQMVQMYMESFTNQKQMPQTQQTIQTNKKKSIKTPCMAILVALHLSILHQMCGVKAVIAYGGQIIGELKPELKLTMPIFINLLQCVGSVFASFLLTKIGRKKLLEMGSLAEAIGTCMIGVGFMNGSFTWILCGLIFFMTCFGLTLGPVTWIYLSEITQPNILSLAVAANWGTCTVVMLFFPIIKKQLPNQNPAYLFFFYAIWCLGAFLINLKFVIETKNKGQKQITAEFEKLMADD